MRAQRVLHCLPTRGGAYDCRVCVALFAVLRLLSVASMHWRVGSAQCALVPRTRAVDTTSMDRYRACGMLHLFAAAAVRVVNACVRFSCIARKLCWRLGSALSLEEELDLTWATPSPSTVPRYQWYVVAAYLHSLRSQCHTSSVHHAQTLDLSSECQSSWL